MIPSVPQIFVDISKHDVASLLLSPIIQPVEPAQTIGAFGMAM